MLTCCRLADAELLCDKHPADTILDKITINLRRKVRQGKIITAAGVSAGIDMALSLVALEQGEEMAQTIQLLIEYDPQPPFNTGTRGKASPAILERAKKILSVVYSQAKR